MFHIASSIFVCLEKERVSTAFLNKKTRFKRNTIPNAYNLRLIYISDPNCSMGYRQNMSCNYITNDMSHSEAYRECNRLELFSHKDHSIPLSEIDWSALTNESLIWIGQAQSSVVNEDGYCQAWSLRKNQYQSVPCDTQLPTFCQSDLIGNERYYSQVSMYGTVCPPNSS